MTTPVVYIWIRDPFSFSNAYAATLFAIQAREQAKQASCDSCEFRLSYLRPALSWPQFHKMMHSDDFPALKASPTVLMASISQKWHGIKTLPPSTTFLTASSWNTQNHEFPTCAHPSHVLNGTQNR